MSGAGPVTVTLRCDAAPLLSALQAVLDASGAQGRAQLGDRLFRLCKFPDQLVAIKVDADPAAADQVIVRLDPSDRLLGLVAASGARNG